MNELNVKQILEMQNDNYSKRIGTVFGTYRIDDIRYNWVTRTQEWKVSCIKCGTSEIVPASVGRDWLRGKGRSQYKCKICQEESKKSEKIKKQQEKEAIKLQLDSFIGKEINGWLISERNGNTFRLLCQTCGRQKKASLSELNNSKIAICKHPKNFSSQDYIGKRYGNITVIGYENGDFKIKCDCGFEKNVKPSCVDRGKITSCGRANCRYHIATANRTGTGAGIAVSVGYESEIEVQKWLKSLGYTVERTPSSGDFGVDLIATGRDGSKVALQVKNNSKTKSYIGVSAVQEVYAGGIYYGCSKFGVVSYTGYTQNAKLIADKLGVMLLTERCELYDFENKYNINTKNFWTVNGKAEPILETFRREGWTEHYEKFSGMTYEQIKAHYDKRNIRKDQLRKINELGLSEPFVSYRMKKMGMTFEEAISTPKVTTGRPKKEKK